MKRFIILLLILSFALPSEAFFFSKKNKALENELKGKGYAGTLPNLEEKIEKSQTKVTSPIFEPQEGFDNPAELKPVPKDNPAFINIIQKKDKTSDYALTMSEIIPMLEKLADCIESDESLQLFVTKANLLTLNIDNVNEKYSNKPESYYDSYKKLMDVNRYIKSLAELRREAVVYQRYLAYSSSGSIYNPDNISAQLQYLLEEIRNVIVLLREEG